MPDFTQNLPIVSIGMPVFNCERTISQAIRSILNQTFQSWELLIIDDGSRDNTFSIAMSFRDPRILVIRGGDNRGLPERLNECIQRGKGRFFARMDGDDVAYPERLERQVALLDKQPELDLVGGWVVIFRDDGTAFGARRGPITHRAICAHPWTGIHLAHPTWVGKMEWFRRNPYRTDAVRMEDQDLLFRTFTGSRFAAVPQVVLGYREDSLSLRKLLVARQQLCKLLLRQGLERRQWSNAAVGIAAHVAKGIADTVAILSGLNYRILRHRALPILQDEQDEWRSVWKQVVEGSVSGSV